ncbi:MAG: hypothetical protein CMD85_01450 [Gammaproteobacteria bacterium]|nr:hypothetical protein [Gammaproteobacteria bacterium]|tara:strand:+ start:388 stop:2487 length:2100 start_codon:yes stop_codon:yes gene_type:complete
MKRMLINATQPEELRVALIDGQSIYDFDIEQRGQERKRSNIYKAKVSRIEQSLGAAFVNFGAEKHGFLPIKELAPEYLKNPKKRNSITECLTQGQEIIVQVDKEERGTKGAALSTFISLPGHFLVLMPNNPEAGGISRSLEGKDREEVKEKFRQLDIPKGMGLIVRTAAQGASYDELKWDLEYLVSVWEAIIEANQLRKAPFLIYRDDDLISRSLRDFLREDITEVLVDSDEAFEKAYEFTGRLTPDLQEKIKRYDESIPLFTRYQVESQIETAYQREVKLVSGGSIIIDQTEALVSIDINSSKATGASDIEETALKTNLEAAREIAKQLRLRDIGGLIVIDFIDMSSLKNKRAVEDAVNQSIAIDRAKIQVGRISRFGLLEMSRQRLRPSLQERWTQDINSLSIAVLRLIEEEASKKKSGEVRAIVSSDMSIFLLNERRSRISEIEEKTDVRIVVVSDPSRSDNRFEVNRIRTDDKKNQGEASYDIQDEVENLTKPELDYKNKKMEKAAVDMSPKRKPKSKGKGFFSKLIDTLSGEQKSKEKKGNIKSKPKSKKNNYKKSTKSRNQKQGFKKEQNKNNFKKTKKQNNTKKDNVSNKQDLKKDQKSEKVDLKTKNKPKKTTNNQSRVKTQKDGNKPALKKDGNKPAPKKDGNKPAPKKDDIKKEKVTEKTSLEEKKPIEKPAKAAKDWGRASNDPRNKT